MTNYTPIYKLYEEKIKKCRKCEFSGNQLTKPWIGKDYHREDPKILFVGINMNKPGPGDTDLPRFIENHPEELSRRLYGFMPKLAKQVLSLGQDSPRQLYEHFSFTNIIKCSPNVYRSNPIKEMWNKCFYIKDEIELLKPDIIVAMGNDCYAGIIKQFKENRKELVTSEVLQKHMTKIIVKEKMAFILRIDHPSGSIAIPTTKSRLSLVLEFIDSESEAYEVMFKINAQLEYFIAGQLIKRATTMLSE